MGKGQIQIAKPKAETPLPNPMIIKASRDDLKTAALKMLETREIPVEREDCSDQTGECTILTKHVVFIKGITTKSQLQHYCIVPTAGIRTWTRGRYVLKIQVNPSGVNSCQVGVYCSFEGLSDGATGSEWIKLSSRGIMEEKFLKCLEETVRSGVCREGN